MGYYGKLEEKKLAQFYRSKGESYGEIQKKIKVSKDTLSRWCRDIILSPEQLERLRDNKRLGADKGRLISAKNQQQLRIARTKELFPTTPLVLEPTTTKVACHPLLLP